MTKVKKCCHNLFCVSAGLTCTDSQADLEPDLYQLMTSAYLEDKQLFLLQVIKKIKYISLKAFKKSLERS